MALEPETWRRLSPMLDQLLDMPAPAREPWLADLQSHDPEAAEALRSLLAGQAAIEAAGFLSGQAAEPAVHVGQRVGGYTLVAPLGEGGMGAVWLAERSDGRFEGRAAVKLLHAGLLRQSLIERFRREGATLARLTHPHIARLLDAGLTDGGQPYLVLEHVAGQRIDLACDERRWDVRTRIRLFAQVLDAVQHAHTRLVVHRDLKPGNLMVDDAGQVKLLDFGIAKLLDADDQAGEATELTRESGRVLTPMYAAPEQTRGDPVTTATDVYALGLVLYGLLTGQHPWVDAQGHLDPRLESSPPLASKAVLDTGRRDAATLEGDASNRGVSPGRLASLLAGDLDNILAKAMRQDPNDRYATAAAFAEDLARHLAGETVRAAPDSLSYRVSRFVGRHRLGVSMSALAAAALLATSMVALWQWRAALDHLREAEFASRHAIAAQGFASEWLRSATEGRDHAGQRALLDDARRILQTQVFDDDPVILAYLKAHLAGRFGQFGAPAAQLALLQEIQPVLAKTDRFVDQLTVANGMAYTANELGRSREALTLIDASRALFKKVPDADVRAESFQYESYIRTSLGQHDEAVRAAVEGTALLERGGMTALPAFRILRSTEVRALAAAGRSTEAIAGARQLLDEMAASGNSGTLTARRMSALIAEQRFLQGDIDGARLMLDEPWARGAKAARQTWRLKAWLDEVDGRLATAWAAHDEAARLASDSGAALDRFTALGDAFRVRLRMDPAQALQHDLQELRGLGDRLGRAGVDVAADLAITNARAAIATGQSQAAAAALNSLSTGAINPRRLEIEKLRRQASTAR